MDWGLGERKSSGKEQLGLFTYYSYYYYYLLYCIVICLVLRGGIALFSLGKEILWLPSDIVSDRAKHKTWS